MAHRITVNGEPHLVDAAPDTPLLYVLRNDLGLNGPKFGCGLGQCGACAAIMAAKVLLDRNRNPSEEEIKNALEDQLCRCGVHNRVVNAVRRAAEELAK